jgi:nucleotide-binding universal stress UspA family protein
MDYSGFAAAVPDPSIFEESARAVLEQTIAALDGETKGVKIERLVRMDHPAQALIEAAKEAELLVVGSRGHGGFVGLLLGSVSHQVALHARCPVVIVHEPGATN